MVITNPKKIKGNKRITMKEKKKIIRIEMHKTDNKMNSNKV